jgi:hypothetical protein
LLIVYSERTIKERLACEANQGRHIIVDGHDEVLRVRGVGCQCELETITIHREINTCSTFPDCVLPGNPDLHNRIIGQRCRPMELGTNQRLHVGEIHHAGPISRDSIRSGMSVIVNHVRHCVPPGKLKVVEFHESRCYDHLWLRVPRSSWAMCQAQAGHYQSVELLLPTFKSVIPISES